MRTVTASTVIEGPCLSTAPGAKRARFGARRRVLLLACTALLLLLAVAANYGPLREWRNDRATLEKTQAQVSRLSSQKAQLEAQLKKMSDPSYIEDLARQDLTYARPGEDMFIVNGLPADNGGKTGASPTRVATIHKPGPLERILSALGRLL